MLKMLKRIKILALLQISDRFKFKKIENKKRAVANILIRILSLILITAVCAVFVYLICNIMMVPKTVNLLVFIIFFIQLISIISCANGLLKSLYTSKDNMILLSYPAKHVEVFLSKLLVFYFYELIKSIFFIVPLLLGFGIILNLITFNYIVALVLMAFFMPLFPVLIGALITIPILYIKRFLNAHGWIKALIALAVMVGLFILLDMLLGKLPVPLRLVALYNAFMMKITSFISSVNKFALFYNFIGQIFFGERIFINYLIIFGIIIGLVILVALISMPLYFKLACKSTESANIKKHKGTNKAHSNTFLTFVRKEWLLSIRNIGEFVNNYIFLFATPYVLYTMVTLFSSVDRNLLGEQMTIVFAGLIALVMASSSNTSSAMAITSEGSEFVLLKTAPGKVSNMAWAKILFNLVSSTVMLFISFLLVIILCDRITDKTSMWLMLLAVVILNAGLIFWSFEMDILKPNLREYATVGSTDNLKNFSKSIMIGFIVSVLFTVLSLLFLIDDANIVWSWGRIIGLSVIFLLARLYLFRSNLNAYFKEIEY